MTKNKRIADAKPLTMDKRIKQVIDESWIAPVYFNAAITELLNKFNAMSDEELTRYMEGPVAAPVARQHLTEIYQQLNPTPQ